MLEKSKDPKKYINVLLEVPSLLCLKDAEELRNSFRTVLHSVLDKERSDYFNMLHPEQNTNCFYFILGVVAALFINLLEYAFCDLDIIRIKVFLFLLLSIVTIGISIKQKRKSISYLTNTDIVEKVCQQIDLTETCYISDDITSIEVINSTSRLRTVIASH